MYNRPPIKRIAIMGSTGSIGTQALAVILANPNKFSVEILTANSNAHLLIKQALACNPNCVVIGDKTKYVEVMDALKHTDVKVFCGEEALEEVAAMDIYDTMLAAIVGFVGLKPTLQAIQNNKVIALANKEVLVVAGDIVTALAAKHRAAIIPIDSEHSAIFQCLQGEQYEQIQKIILTASGGPFLGKKPNFLTHVRAMHALQHPNWSMGKKISVDSATLMNKGLEMIEAKWLFNLLPEQIDVVVHPQSIVHSIVQFEDGSMKAQMGLPDMRIPIQYALTYPTRVLNNFPRYDFSNPNTLVFEKPDSRTFRNLQIAIIAMQKGGNMPCIMNAANEVVVAAFLKEKIGFLEMSDVIEATMNKINFIATPTLQEYFVTDQEARIFATSLIK